MAPSQQSTPYTASLQIIPILMQIFPLKWEHRLSLTFTGTHTKPGQQSALKASQRLPVTRQSVWYVLTLLLSAKMSPFPPAEVVFTGIEVVLAC